MSLKLISPQVAYTELKAASFYSFLRGGSSPQEMVKTAFHAGLSGLALTDLGGVYGAPKAYQALKELRLQYPEAKNFKLIVGAEILLTHCSLPSVTLLAVCRKSYGALCQLITRSHEGRAKGTGELSFKQLIESLKRIPGADQLLMFCQWEEYWLNHRQEFSQSSIHEEFKELSSLENPGYVPLARHRDGLDQARTMVARLLAQMYAWPCVAHQNALYHQASTQVVQDVLTSLRENKPLSELGILLNRNSERRLKSTEEMNELFADFPQALVMTSEVQARCHFEMSELRYTYPSEWIPPDHSAFSYLKKLCREGAQERYPQGVPFKVVDQLEREFAMIDELKFSDYFLTVYDIVAFARSQKILCQGRGSAANSVVCYVLGITALDPLQMDFLFERFISVERGEPPDIDVDFEHDRREEVIQYIYQKYGRSRAAMVAAVVTYREKSALREVAKAFGVPVGTLSAREVQKLIATSPDISDAKKAKIQALVESIQDYPRHLSIHSGGFTLSQEPIDTIVPIEPATMEKRTIIQWDKYDLDVLGLLKIDVLSLGMLSVIRRALDQTGLKLYQIPQDDPATYDMICRGDTIGVFQIESRAQMAMLPRLKPRKFYDLVVEIALVRPGPIVGKMVHPYLKRRNQKEEIAYPHPALKAILGRTYGVPIFQEQVMKMAIQVGGFSAGEADQLRRAIGAWRSAGSIDEMGKSLMDGLMKNGMSQEFAQQIFDQIQGFSEYGFPESHSASFSLLAYASSYLKRHHPAAFLTALLNSQPMGFYSPHTLIDDAKRHGVKVLPICVQQSKWDCEWLNAETVRVGLRFVKSLSEDQAAKIVHQRTLKEFRSFQDFRARTEVSSASLRALALASGFESMGLNSREALFEILSQQVGLFQQAEIQSDLFSRVHLPLLNPQETVTQDYAATGLSVRAHPTQFLREYLRSNPLYEKDSKWIELDSKRVRASVRNGQTIRFLGLSVVIQRPPTAKGTAFATMEDEHGLIDLILHREVFQSYKAMIREEAFLWVSGEVQRSGDALQIIVKKIEKIFKEESALEAFQVPHAPGALAR